MEKRTIEIDLETAQSWYRTNHTLKNLALKIFSKEELENVLPTSWNNWYNIQGEGYKFYIDSKCNIQHSTLFTLPPSDIHRNKLNSSQDAKAHLALMQLHVLRDAYRDYHQKGWKPDWKDVNKINFCIYYHKDEIIITTECFSQTFLSFPTEALATKFLENFEDLIEKAKDLI